MRISVLFICTVLFAAACGSQPEQAQTKEPPLTYAWPSWGGDEGGGRYSPLTQINRSNVGTLQKTWTYHTGDVTDGSDGSSRSTFECTPIVVDGVMFISTAFCRAIALDPETGAELWAFDPHITKAADKHWLLTNRGVAFWRSPTGEGRIFLGTMDGDLFCLDAKTGQPVKKFGGGQGKIPHGYLGEGGRVLHGDEASPENLPTEWQGAITSAPTIWKNLVIVGGTLPYMRAYDCLTGRMVWERAKVIKPGEPHYDDWQGPGLARQGSAFSWGPKSVDSERGLLFVGTDSPTPDFYGGARVGDNRPCNSILCIDAATGQTIWEFQISHHDVWDYDIPSQPNLITVQRGGRDIPAVSVVTKQGLLFLFNRVTGEPLFDIVERPVPASKVPGEQLSPTQPFPVAPPPYARQRAGQDEIAQVVDWHTKMAKEHFKKWTIGGLYDPPSPEGTVVFPNTIGGGAWGGGCYDPTSALFFVSASNVGSLMWMVPTGKPERPWARSTADYNNGRFWDNATRMPFTPPPWSTLTALDLNKGTIAWQVPLGSVPQLVKQGITGTGSISIGGGIVTAGGLVFTGASNDRTFYAFDSKSGETLWSAPIDGSGNAVPMTYKGRNTGKQYVVIAAGGGNKYNDHFDDALVAFALP